MEPYHDEAELTNYVWNHFRQFFTPVESKAAWAAFADGKAKAGHSAVAEFVWKRHALAEDSAVVEALADGVEAFRRRTARRILRDHALEVFVNRCPACGRVVLTPRARQCLWCGHDWHPRPAPPRAE